MKQNLAKEGCKLYLRFTCSLPAFDLCLMYNPSLISAFAAPGLKQRFQELTTVHNLKSNICLPPSSSSIITKKHPWYLLTPVAPNLLSNPCIGQLFHRLTSQTVGPQLVTFPECWDSSAQFLGVTSDGGQWPSNRKDPPLTAACEQLENLDFLNTLDWKSPKKKYRMQCTRNTTFISPLCTTSINHPDPHFSVDPQALEIDFRGSRLPDNVPLGDLVRTSQAALVPLHWSNKIDSGLYNLRKPCKALT